MRYFLRWMAGGWVIVALVAGRPVELAGVELLAAAKEPAKDGKSTKPQNERKKNDEHAGADGLAAGHSMHGEAFNEGPRQAAYLMGQTGSVQFPITTASAEAQAFFNQGVGQLHGFWYFESERSFRQVAQLDPGCAMAYWGMAQSNWNNPERAKKFVAKAVERREQATPRERLWIDAANAFFTAKADDKARHRKYIRDLENILHEHPDDLEAKAFLCVELWHADAKGVSINSHQAIDAMLDQIFDKSPMHPAHHYRIHLWDGEKAARALTSAARCGQSAPNIAHMWHMSGHIYSKLKRYGDAAWEQEASARVDHARMIRDHVLPYQIHNYAHNNEWCARDLALVGRVHDAVELAKNLIELPRHPQHNEPNNGGHAAGYGRQRLVEFLQQFELWDDILALADTPYLEASDKTDHKLRRLRLLGAARFGKGQLDQGQQIIEQLKADQKQLAEKMVQDELAAEQKLRAEHADAKRPKFAPPEPTGAPLAGSTLAVSLATSAKSNPPDKLLEDRIAKAKRDARGKHDSDNRRLNETLAQLRAYRALAQGNAKEALAQLAKGGNVRKELRSRAHLLAGEEEAALRLAKESVDADAGDVPALAHYIDVLHQTGRTDKAATMLHRLRTLGERADLDVPIFRRVAPVAKALDLPEDWRLPAAPAPDLGQRPDVKTLGPFRWRPAPAEPWTLLDGTGKPRSLGDYRGRPVIVVFYLGYGCLHCVQQLNALAPKAAEFEQLGVSLIAISTDPLPELKTSLEKCDLPGGFPFPLVSDAEHHVFRAYRAYDDFERKPLHATLLIDPQGLIRWQDIGHEPFNNPAFLLQETKRLLATPVHPAEK